MFWPRWRPLQVTTGWKAARVYTLIVLCLAALQVDAVDIKELEVSEDNGVYQITCTYTGYILRLYKAIYSLPLEPGSFESGPGYWIAS